MTLDDLEAVVRERDLIGTNLHYNPDTDQWTCWTRRRGSDGWTRPGPQDNLTEAVAAAFGIDGEDDIGDLV